MVWRLVGQTWRAFNKNPVLACRLAPLPRSSHFPGYPVMPGVLILEALAQASGLLAFKTPSLCPPNESLYLFVGIDKARFKKPVVPGDQLVLKVEMKKSKGGFAVFEASATVDQEVAAYAEIMCGFKELPEKL